MPRELVKPRGTRRPVDVTDGLAEVIADFMEHGVINARTQQGLRAARQRCRERTSRIRRARRRSSTTSTALGRAAV